MKIYLHVGAHKTATTYLQSVLAANLASLNRDGVGYLPAAMFRPRVTRRLMSAPPEKLRPEKMLKQFFGKGLPSEIRGLIMSDENLIGDCGGFIRTGHLYPRVDVRLRRLREILAGHEITLFFAIRSYDSFIASAYCEALRHSKVFFPFTDVRARLAIDQSRWPVVLSRMMQALEPVAVVVWRYEDFRANADTIIRTLAFGSQTEIKAGTNKAERPSFSQTATEILEMVAERYGAAVAADLVRPIGDSLPKGGEHKAFDPWCEEERQYLKRLYSEDCTNLPVQLLTLDHGPPSGMPLVS